MIDPIFNAVHLCLDMQNLFAPGAVWQTPWLERVLPGIVRLVEHHPARTIFTRFIPPEKPEDRRGRWQHYFRRWACVTRARLPSSQLDLVPTLNRFVPPAHIIDKPGYSAFHQTALDETLTSKGVTTLLITGSETDVCVLSSVLAAVDRGYRVVVIRDCLCSSSDEGHDALMKLYHTRFTEQIDLIDLAEAIERWSEPA